MQGKEKGQEKEQKQEQGQVNIVVNAGIGKLTFSHPKSNSLPRALLSSIAKGIQELGSNHEARVIILASDGPAFCAGASFDELKAVKTFEQGLHFFQGFSEVILAMRSAPKFIIARVHGKAVGGGVGLAAAADIAMATSASAVKLSELALGIGPFVVGPAVERKIGKSAFSSLSIDADWRTATWAKEHGLFSAVYETTNELDSQIELLAQKLAKYSPVAMAELKAVLWEGTEGTTLLPKRAEISGRLVLSDFSRKALEA